MIPNTHTIKANGGGHIASHEWLPNRTFFARTERKAIDHLLEALGRAWIGQPCPDCGETIRTTKHFASRRTQ